MNESIDRAIAVQLYRDIKLVRRMLRIANPNLKERNRDKNEDLEGHAGRADQPLQDNEEDCSAPSRRRGSWPSSPRN